ncbi:adenine deaminase [Mariniblastus sp.]|nr:adenine deaminase [Mariniblastus sp.]
MEFSVTHNLVDVHTGEIYSATVSVANGVIQQIVRHDEAIDPAKPYLMPGFVDAHIHVESSMLLPDQFARVAVTHGTVATVSDPHEIANVCGIDGVELMLRNAAQTNFKFCFGAPSCVPATEFETAGARINAAQVTRLLDDPRIGYLSEVMDFPGVLNRAPEVMAKINAAIERNKPVDGHAPGLRGDMAAKYVSAGITTDHECFTLDEALDKLAAGCKIAIREGSAARNYDALESLIDSHPEMVMLCSDDKHPDEFLLGHINQLAARAIAGGRDLMNVLRVACVNPVEHYGLNVGLLREGDPADFILVEDLKNFQVIETYLDGTKVAQSGECLMPATSSEAINNFVAEPISQDDLALPAGGKNLRLIDAIDGQLITEHSNHPTCIENGLAVADTENDIVKIVVINRYGPAKPAIAFVRGFGLKSGAFASSVAHDSHNVVAVGTNDADLTAAINAVIKERGGLSVSSDGQTDVLPLPVAGLMSTESCEWVAERYEKLDQRVKSMGSNLRAPYMTLSFMALLVIPSLKLSDKGLFDGDNFVFTSVFAD